LKRSTVRRSCDRRRVETMTSPKGVRVNDGPSRPVQNDRAAARLTIAHWREPVHEAWLRGCRTKHVGDEMTRQHLRAPPLARCPDCVEEALQCGKRGPGERQRVEGRRTSSRSGRQGPHTLPGPLRAIAAAATDHESKRRNARASGYMSASPTASAVSPVSLMERAPRGCSCSSLNGFRRAIRGCRACLAR
jgi:hypothetical protein